MPKFTYEIDTDARTTKAWIDENEVSPPPEFSIGCYRIKPYEHPEEEYTSCYTSITHDIGDNGTMTYSYSFSDGKEKSYSEAVTRSVTNVAKQVAKTIGNLIASVKLEKALLAKGENKH